MTSKSGKKRSSEKRKLRDKKKKVVKKRSVDKRKLSGYERFVNQQMKKINTDPRYNNLTMQEKLNLIENVWKAVR